MIRWIVLGLAFSSVLVLLIATPVWAEGIPKRFHGAWCTEESRIVVSYSYMEGSKLKCHVPTWLSLPDNLPGNPIVALMECSHKFDDNFEDFKMGQTWVAEENALTVTNIDDVDMNRSYQRCTK